MKIIHIIPNLRKGGAERLAINICQELQDSGHVVCLVTFETDNDYQFLTKNINHQVIPSSVQFSVRGRNRYEIDELQTFITTFNPDVIHTHLFYSEAVLTGVKFASAKYFMHMHDNMRQLGRMNIKELLNKVHWTNLYERKVVLKKMFERKTTVIAISKDSFNYSKKNLAKNTDVILLHNAIDVNRFRTENKWEERSRRIVMTGSLVEKKGQELAIRIISALHEIGLNFQLDLLGDGELKSRLQSLSNELNLTKHVHFHGNVDHPESYLQNAQIYLHTATYEPFGLAILEAMASGTPVLCTDGTGNRDLVDDNVNGLIHFNRNPKELAKRIETLLTDEELRMNIVKKARLFAATFSIQEYTKNLLAEYDSH